jgi:hypothetical protein
MSSIRPQAQSQRPNANLAAPCQGRPPARCFTPLRTAVAMSALGQKQTYAVHQPMSALRPIATAKADIRPGSCPLYPRKRTHEVQQRMSALGQKRTHAAQQKGSLFDHFVGPQQKRGRNGYPQRVSSSHVDYRFEFRRPFDRQFTRIGPSRGLTSKDTYQPIQAE